MAYFEYRLFAESKGFPVLFSYESMEAEEVALRFACDRFVKEGRVYEKTSAANEGDTYVVYVEEKRTDQLRVMGQARPTKPSLT